jgi:DNA-binding winged helix-turn-helix (wHTH) protein
MRYSVDNVDLDPDSFEICINGVPVEAEPRVLEFIFYLFRYSERMVSKAELLEHVWRTDSISESALTRAACLARKLLGNFALIRTIYGRGYQWKNPASSSDIAASRARGPGGGHGIASLAGAAGPTAAQARPSAKVSVTS